LPRNVLRVPVYCSQWSGVNALGCIFLHPDEAGFQLLRTFVRTGAPFGNGSLAGRKFDARFLQELTDKVTPLLGAGGLSKVNPVGSALDGPVLGGTTLDHITGHRIKDSRLAPLSYGSGRIREHDGL